MMSIKLLLVRQCFEMGLNDQGYHRRRRVGKVLRHVHIDQLLQFRGESDVHYGCSVEVDPIL